MNPEIIFDNNVREFSDIIESVEELSISDEEGLVKLKAKLKIYNSTVLWVREIISERRLIAYSYYWLRPDNSLILGWDNAPHHPEVDTFPHHKHIGEKNEVRLSQENKLTDVLKFIRDFIG